MELIVLVGFLGAGKTTALLNLARAAAAGGAKVAIVINEIGDIGIDDAVLRRLDANVWELVGGCICCTLAGELAGTLTAIAERFGPDVVFVEPSGASHPDAMFQALENGRGPAIRSIRRLAVIDPLRLEMLVAVLQPLVESHLVFADVVAIGKADLASEEELRAARAWVAGLRPELPCHVLDMKSGSQALCKELMPWL